MLHQVLSIWNKFKKKSTHRFRHGLLTVGPRPPVVSDCRSFATCFLGPFRGPFRGLSFVTWSSLFRWGGCGNIFRNIHGRHFRRLGRWTLLLSAIFPNHVIFLWPELWPRPARQLSSLDGLAAVMPQMPGDWGLRNWGGNDFREKKPNFEQVWSFLERRLTHTLKENRFGETWRNVTEVPLYTSRCRLWEKMAQTES